jgi:hypothetical protein
MYNAVGLLDEMYDKINVNTILIVALACLILTSWVLFFVLQSRIVRLEKRVDKLEEREEKRIEKTLTVNAHTAAENENNNC